MNKFFAVLCGAAVIAAVLGSGVVNARREADQIVEIRSYTLKPGTRARFQQLFIETRPMLERRKIDVVAHGPSLHDDNSYYLIRAFASLEDRQRSEDAFYNSDEWRQGPRDAVLACIDTYTTVVVTLDAATVGGLRR